MSRPRFFAPEAGSRSTTAALPPDEAHHLRDVLRLRPGAEIAVFDGRGHEWVARVAQAARRSDVTVELDRAIEPVSEPAVEVTLAIGLLKGDQMDAVVRDATMLGVGAIVPIISEHVAVPARGRQGGAAVERWRRVAVASVKQCGRAVVPRVALPERFELALSRIDAEMRLMCVEPARAGANAIGASPLERPRSALALVGPEGGWSAGEVARAERDGARLIQLGSRTLRAESAPTVLLSALWTVWGW